MDLKSVIKEDVYKRQLLYSVHLNCKLMHILCNELTHTYIHTHTGLYMLHCIYFCVRTYNYVHRAYAFKNT